MWWTRRALALHVTVVLVVPTFIALFWWQVQRVREGNTLSWAYVFEWPFFTGYAVYLWWKLVHDQPDLTQPSAAATDAGLGTARDAATDDAAGPGAVDPPVAPAGAARGPEPDGEEADGADPDGEALAAYNRYLAQLNATGQRKTW